MPAGSEPRWWRRGWTACAGCEGATAAPRHASSPLRMTERAALLGLERPSRRLPAHCWLRGRSAAKADAGRRARQQCNRYRCSGSTAAGWSTLLAGVATSIGRARKDTIPPQCMCASCTECAGPGGCLATGVAPASCNVRHPKRRHSIYDRRTQHNYSKMQQCHALGAPARCASPCWLPSGQRSPKCCTRQAAARRPARCAAPAVQ